MPEAAHQLHELQRDSPAMKNQTFEEDQAAQGVNMIEFSEDHNELAAVQVAYARKVHIFNKIINEKIGMTPWQYGLSMVAGFWLAP